MDQITKVAFVGRMMVGKTTARRLLEEENYTGLAFADRVKTDAIRMINGLEEQYYAEFLTYDPIRLTREKLDADKQVFRPLLQWLGTEYFRDYRGRPTHWIDMLGERIKSEEQMGERRFVVDDARFENEIEALKSWGFTIIRIQAPEATWMNRMIAKYGTASSIAETMAHGSETLADSLPADLTILNSGSVANLRDALLDVLGIR